MHLGFLRTAEWKKVNSQVGTLVNLGPSCLWDSDRAAMVECREGVLRALPDTPE